MRITGGTLAGRKLVAPRGLSTRPTSDRVREALFAVLGNRVNGTVLDLYAGTGALGLEAISRGAKRGVFVERARPALLCLEKNVERLGCSAAVTILPIPVERALPRILALGPFDWVFCDPPYVDLNRVCDHLVCHGGLALLRTEGQLLLEHPHGWQAPNRLIDSLEYVDRREWGGTAVSWFRWPSESGETDGNTADVESSKRLRPRDSWPENAEKSAIPQDVGPVLDYSTSIEAGTSERKCHDDDQ